MHRVPVLMTRPAGSNRPFLDRIAPDLRRKLDVVTSPLILIEPLAPQGNMDRTAAAIFTSSNGVKHAPRGAGRIAYCVGTQTAETARKSGWEAVCKGEDVTDLVESLRQNVPDCDLVHFHGRHVRGNLAVQLREAGAHVTSVTVYDQVLQPLTQEALDVLSSGSVVLVPIFSPRTAGHFATLAPVCDHTHVIAMSAAVADECTANGFQSVFVAKSPTAASMVTCLEKRLIEVCPG